MKLKYLASICSAMCCAMPITSFAQGEQLIEEVVVTAAKRTQTLQEIPIAVSVTSGETIGKAEIIDLADLQSVVPSLQINTLQNSTNTNFLIRGFGNGANNPGIEPSVGVFIDGVYRSRSASSISDLPNIERVEVLRGPQSTLFGKNASAGVINVVTKEPTGEFGGRVSATLGNYGQVILKGQVEGALSDNTAYSLYASTNTRDGYYDNRLTGNEINERDRQAFRGQLVIRPSDATKIRLIADYDKIDESCCGVNNLFQSPLETFAYGLLGAQLNANDPEALNGFYNRDPSNEIENNGISMQIDVDYENMTLTSITSFRQSEANTSVDVDFISADLVSNNIDTEIDTFTQEIRLASSGDNALDWMIGSYYFKESIDHQNDLVYGSDFRNFADILTLAAGAPNALAGLEQALGLPVGQAFFPANGIVRNVDTLDNDAISIFGEVNWHLSGQLTATLGLNYTKDEKDASVRETQRDTFSSLDLVQIGFAGIFRQLTGGAAPTPQNFAMFPQAAAQAQALSTTSANPLLGLRSLQFLPPFLDYPNPIEDGKSDDDEVTYTFRLAYDLNDAVNIYGGISTGFKASSWNLSRDARPTAADLNALQAAGLTVPNLTAGTRFANPEESTVYELGLKARFARGAFNMAIFDQEIKNFQSNLFVGTGFNLANAGRQSTKGVEFDLVYYPTEALQLTLAGTFLDPKYDEFLNASGIPTPNNPSGVVDLSGRTPTGIHKTSISTSATYNFILGNGLAAYIRGDFQYDSKEPTNENVPETISSREFKNLNMSAGVRTDNGLAFSIWARNLTDHETATTGFPTTAGTGGYFGYRNQPRTYGVTFSKDF